MVVIIVIILIVTSYLLMIKPNLNKDRLNKMKPFEEVLLTHRGFYNNDDIPENSLKAFKKTVKEGYGTELDVQMTTDGKLVVFHDASLLRMCGVDKKLTDCSYDELMNYSLLNTEEKIPLFKDVLDILHEDTPLIVEIKPEGDCINTCEKALTLLSQYKRNFTMESFNPLVVRYLKRKHPNIIRGQLAYNMVKDRSEGKHFLISFILTNLLENFLTKPDYVAYDIKNMSNLSFKIISKIYKGECVAWTVKSENDLTLAKNYYQQFIFDSFVPKH